MTPTDQPSSDDAIYAAFLAGERQIDIADRLNLHRNMVWRAIDRVQRKARRAAASAAARATWRGPNPCVTCGNDPCLTPSFCAVSNLHSARTPRIKRKAKSPNRDVSKGDGL